jgi:hypothetical protein
VTHKPSLILKLAIFRLSHARVHVGACLNNEKVVTSARVVKKRALFFTHLFTQIASHEQPWRPHGQPEAATMSGVLLTKSVFTYARKNIHPGGPRNKNSHLQKANS